MVVTSVDRTVKNLLVRLVVLVGAVVGAWLLFAGIAAADEKPKPDRVLDLVVNVLAPLNGGASGETSNSVNAAPVPTPEPMPEPVATTPQADVVTAPPVVNTKPVAPKPAPAPELIAAEPQAVAPVHVTKVPVRQAAPVRKPAPSPANLITSPAKKADEQPIPDQPAAPGSPGGPLASSAPASSTVDTNGHARGMSGLPAGHDPLSPLTYVGIEAPCVDDLPGRDAGLPASSPD
ncbi:MAG TPA: hypothetical protein VM677_26475 [Actinokineospora sp.]|nr:hypothetical protein [Actinokineospora sp.]